MINFITILFLSIIPFIEINTNPNVPKAVAPLSHELDDRPIALGTPLIMIPEIELQRHPVTGEIVPEVWKSIKGYVGLYRISNYGRVLSVKRIIIRKNGHPQTIHELILSPGKNQGKNTDYNRGYYFTVMLCDHGVDKMRLVHTLVADAFIPKIKGKPEVNHINEIKHDNFVFNLEWSNHYENNSYKKKNKTSKYYGVHWVTHYSKWKAQLIVNSKLVFLGQFSEEEDANTAVKEGIIKYKLINKYS